MTRTATGSADRFHGTDPLAVVAAIKARADRLARGEPIADGRKIGLVIEGGSMRGVLSAGGALALARMGMQRAFDAVFATSAGVMNAAYFLSDQPDLGISIYFEDLATRQFINPWRFWKILDVDYVFDHVVIKSKPLDVSRIRQSASEFFVAMIDCQTAEPLLVDAGHGPVPTLTCLKAATAIPVLYNRSVHVGDRRCMDGGMLNPFPLRDAIAASCTDILVFLTQPADYVRQSLSWPEHFAYDVLSAHGRRRHSALLRNYPLVDREVRRLALGESPIPPGVRIAALCPSHDGYNEASHLDGRAAWKAASEYCEMTLRQFGWPNATADIAPPGENARG